MSDKTSICNKALGHIGIGKKIQSFDTEQNAEARACREFYEGDRRQTLRDFSWPFAANISVMSLVTLNPNIEWGAAYQYPSDCVNFRRLLSGDRNPTRYGRIPHRIINMGGAKVILCDLSSAYGEYTLDVSNTNLFTDDFEMALSLRLAVSIAPQICGANAIKMGQLAMQRYMLAIDTAKANARNEEQADIEPESEFILARDGGAGYRGRWGYGPGGLIQ